MEKTTTRFNWKKILKISGIAFGVCFLLLVIIAIIFPQSPEVANSDKTNTASSSEIQATSSTQNTTDSVAEEEDLVDNITTGPIVSSHAVIANQVPQKAGASNLYPDSTLTPGDVFDVDAKTICVSGYTATVRNVPLSVRKKVYSEYGVSYPQPTGNYEVDHFIPLELGGSNDIKNLWLEPANPTPGFHQKDVYENYAHKQVCGGEITLQEAQKRMAIDWYMYWQQISKTSTKTTAQVTTGAQTTTQTASQPVPTQDSSGPQVKKSSSGICHDKSDQYYAKTKDYTPYSSMEACIASGGRASK